MKFILFYWMSMVGHMMISVIAGFLVLPPEIHGKWIINGDSNRDGSIDIDADTVTASFKSAKLKLSVKECLENDTFHFHDMQLLERPSAFDMRQIWKGMSYFHAVQKHGIYIQLLQYSKETLWVHYRIHENKKGYLILVKNECPYEKKEI